MSDAFISYRRKPSEEFASLLQEKLKTKKVDAFIDTQRLEKGEFSPQLIKAIKNSPNFICLLADGTLDSEWVRKEIQLAYEQGKHFVPVFLHHQSYQYDKVVSYIKSNPAIAKLFEFQGVEVHNVADINYYADRIAKLLILKKPYWQRVLIGSLVLLWILFFIILTNPFNLNNLSDSDQTHTPESVVELSPTASETATTRPINTLTDEPIFTEAATIRPSDTPTDGLSPTMTSTSHNTPSIESFLASLTLEYPTNGETETVETIEGTTLLVGMCTTRGESYNSLVPRAMDGLSQNIDFLPNDYSAIGVRFIECGKNELINVFIMPSQSALDYKNGLLSEQDFRRTWRVIDV